tara:strand:- start:1178 stop:1360 length:183 start_codon:yes stop_codon:yes gene_type:complete
LENTKKDFLLFENNVLASKLAVRDSQYKIALEGLKTIRDSNDPMGVAEKTIEAMLDCLPE